MVFTKILGIFYAVGEYGPFTNLPFGAVPSTLTLVYIYCAFTSLGEDTVLKQMMQLLKACLVSSYDEPTHFES